MAQKQAPPLTLADLAKKSRIRFVKMIKSYYLKPSYKCAKI